MQQQSKKRKHNQISSSAQGDQEENAVDENELDSLFYSKKTAFPRKGPKITEKNQVYSIVNNNTNEIVTLDETQIQQMLHERRQNLLATWQSKVNDFKQFCRKLFFLFVFVLLCQIRKEPALGEWDAKEQMVRIIKVKGKQIQQMGLFKKTDKGTFQFLFPEEALFLFDQGDLKINIEDGELETIQKAYELFINCECPTPIQTTSSFNYQITLIDRFILYSHLKRLGFYVKRHIERDDYNTTLQSFTPQEVILMRNNNPTFRNHSSRNNDINISKYSISHLQNQSNPSHASRGWWMEPSIEPASIASINSAATPSDSECFSSSQYSLIQELQLKKGDRIALNTVLQKLKIISQQTISVANRNFEQMVPDYDVWKSGSHPTKANPTAPNFVLFLRRIYSDVPSPSWVEQQLLKYRPSEVFLTTIEGSNLAFVRLQPCILKIFSS